MLEYNEYSLGLLAYQLRLVKFTPSAVPHKRLGYATPLRSSVGIRVVRSSRRAATNSKVMLFQQHRESVISTTLLIYRYAE